MAKNFSGIIKDLVSYGFEVVEYKNNAHLSMNTSNPKPEDWAILQRKHPAESYCHRLLISSDGRVNDTEYTLWKKLNMQFLKQK